MTKYIDRFAALSILCKACGNKDCQKDVRQRCGWFKEMNDLPAADVVPTEKFLDVLVEMGADVEDNTENLVYGASDGYSLAQIIRAIDKSADMRKEADDAKV